jgi:uncharacterized protein YneF (UPF0154 family)
MKIIIGIILMFVGLIIGMYLGEKSNTPDNHNNTMDDYRDEEDEE